jgi:hypothetical protein
MALVMKLETNGTLGNMFVSTFGQWYLYPQCVHYNFCTLLGLSFNLIIIITCCCPSDRLVEGLKGQPTFQMLSNNF